LLAHELFNIGFWKTVFEDLLQILELILQATAKDGHGVITWGRLDIRSQTEKQDYGQARDAYMKMDPHCATAHPTVALQYSEKEEDGSAQTVPISAVTPQFSLCPALQQPNS
jgi:hypothetical protein